MGIPCVEVRLVRHLETQEVVAQDRLPYFCDSEPQVARVVERNAFRITSALVSLPRGLG